MLNCFKLISILTGTVRENWITEHPNHDIEKESADSQLVSDHSNWLRRFDPAILVTLTVRELAAFIESCVALPMDERSLHRAISSEGLITAAGWA